MHTQTTLARTDETKQKPARTKHLPASPLVLLLLWCGVVSSGALACLLLEIHTLMRYSSHKHYARGLRCCANARYLLASDLNTYLERESSVGENVRILATYPRTQRQQYCM